MKKLLLLAALLLAGEARAQTSSVQQSGVVVPGHIVCFSFTGTIYDCGPGGGALAIGQTSIVGGFDGGILYDNHRTLGIEGLGTIFGAPGPIGGVTPSTAVFTQLSVTSIAVGLEIVTGSSALLSPTGPQTIIVRQLSPSPITVSLPASTNYPNCPAIACPSFTIKDGQGIANITLISQDGKQIDGSASYAWSVPRTSLNVTFDGTMWDIN